MPAWRSATGGVAGQDRYTAFGYAHPTRRVLANVLLTRSEVRELEREPGDEQNGEPGATLGYRRDVLDVVGAFVYRPFRRPLRALVQAVKRLQSGRLDAYVAYMLVALVGVLAVVAAMG